MNRSQAVKHLLNGKKITHESWKEHKYICLDGVNVVGDSGHPFNTKNIISLLFNAPNSGFHFWKKKKRKYISFGQVMDILAVSDEKIYHSSWETNEYIRMYDKFIVDEAGRKYNDEDLIFILSEKPNDGWYIYE